MLNLIPSFLMTENCNRHNGRRATTQSGEGCSGRRSRTKHLQLLAGAATLLSLLLADPQDARAGFIKTREAEPSACIFEAIWNWDHTNNTNPGPGPNPNINPNSASTPHWNATVESKGGAGTPFFIESHVNHNPVNSCHTEPNNETQLRLEVTSNAGGEYGTTEITTHGDHADIVRLSANIAPVDPDNPELTSPVFIDGMHVDYTQKLSQWSLDIKRSPSGDNTLTVEIFATFPPASDRERERIAVIEGIKNSGRVQNDGKRDLPDDATDWDYRITEVSPALNQGAMMPASNMELAFLGEVDNVPGKLPLAPAFDFYLSFGLIEAPFFFSETEELFAFVDLTQWLLSPTVIGPLDEIQIVDGLNASLPGYFFSTSPIAVVGNQVVMLDGYTGTVMLLATADGNRIPEPATLSLLGFGLAALWFSRRGAQRRRQRLAVEDLRSSIGAGPPLIHTRVVRRRSPAR